MSTPARVSSLDGSGATSIACGWEFCVAATDRGLVAWGANHEGQCGQEVADAHTIPVPRVIPMAHKLNVAALACGSMHTLLLTRAATVYSWGSNQSGQLGLGHGSSAVVHTPSAPQSLWGIAISKVSISPFVCWWDYVGYRYDTIDVYRLERVMHTALWLLLLDQCLGVVVQRVASLVCSLKLLLELA